MILGVAQGEGATPSLFYGLHQEGAMLLAPGWFLGEGLEDYFEVKTYSASAMGPVLGAVLLAYLAPEQRSLIPWQDTLKMEVKRAL